MVANVYKIFYNPNYLLIFFYFVGLFFLSPLATHSTKLLFGPRFCVCFCYFCLGFVYAFAICLGWLLSLSWLALGCLGDYCRGISATNLTPFAGFLLLGAFGVIFGLLAEKL